MLSVPFPGSTALSVLLYRIPWTFLVARWNDTVCRVSEEVVSWHPLDFERRFPCCSPFFGFCTTQQQQPTTWNWAHTVSACKSVKWLRAITGMGFWRRCGWHVCSVLTVRTCADRQTDSSSTFAASNAWIALLFDLPKLSAAGQ